MIPTPATICFASTISAPPSRSTAGSRSASLIEEFQSPAHPGRRSRQSRPRTRVSPPIRPFGQHTRARSQPEQRSPCTATAICASHGRSLLGLHRTVRVCRRRLPRPSAHGSPTGSEFCAPTASTRASGLPRVTASIRNTLARSAQKALRCSPTASRAFRSSWRPYLDSAAALGPGQKPTASGPSASTPTPPAIADIAALRAFLPAHADQFTSVDRLLARVTSPPPLTFR